MMITTSTKIEAHAITITTTVPIDAVIGVAPAGATGDKTSVPQIQAESALSVAELHTSGEEKENAPEAAPRKAGRKK